MADEYNIIHRSRRTGGVFAQGDVDAAYEAIRSGTFDLVILCAAELEEMFRCLPEREHPKIIYASNEDGPSLTKRQIKTASAAAGQAVRAYREGKRVLITCAAGRNRSGLVTALSLHFATGCGGRMAIEIIRARRNACGPALSNDVFAKFLNAIPVRGRESDARRYLSKVG